RVVRAEHEPQRPRGVVAARDAEVRSHGLAAPGLFHQRVVLVVLVAPDHHAAERTAGIAPVALDPRGLAGRLVADPGLEVERRRAALGRHAIEGVVAGARDEPSVPRDDASRMRDRNRASELVDLVLGREVQVPVLCGAWIDDHALYEPGSRARVVGRTVDEVLDDRLGASRIAAAAHP